MEVPSGLTATTYRLSTAPDGFFAVTGSIELHNQQARSFLAGATRVALHDSSGAKQHQLKKRGRKRLEKKKYQIKK